MVRRKQRMEYKPRTELRPSNLDGISDDQIGVHWALYEGYVDNTNILNEETAELVKAGNAEGTNPRFAELNRRKGFEYNGMVLHECYFEAMNPTSGTPPASLKSALEASFGSYDAWKTEFTAVAKQRGVGWAALYQDPLTGVLSNHWIECTRRGTRRARSSSSSWTSGSMPLPWTGSPTPRAAAST